MKRLTAGDTARMYFGVQTENDPRALIDLAIDQSLPRDIRQTAGKRLDDVRPEAAALIRKLEDQELMLKIARSGMIPKDFREFVKGELKQLTTDKSKLDKINARLLALMEEQNQLLKQLANKRGIYVQRQSANEIPF